MTAVAAAKPIDCIMPSLLQMLIIAIITNASSDKIKELIMTAFMLSGKFSHRRRPIIRLCIFVGMTTV